MKLIGALFIIILFSISLNAQTAIAPAVGDGTEGNPYEIATLENLYWIAADNDVVPDPDRLQRWTSHYRQTADIDASDTENWDNGAGWSPIGIPTLRFNGSYNGGSYTIDGLYINRPDSSSIGFFGIIITGAVIENVGLTNVSITGSVSVGALVGNCLNDSVIISNSYSTGNVSGFINVGGLVGRINQNNIVSNSYSKANASGDDNVGGLIGNNNRGAVINCYSIGNVAGNSNFGGLVGRITIGTGYQDVGNYWNIETSGQSTSLMGSGHTTAGMTFPYAADTYVGWDFQTIWGEDPMFSINNGYPYHYWEYDTPLELLSPNGGEVWQASTVKTIYWRPNWGIQQIDASLSLDNGFSWESITPVPVPAYLGYYSFTLPVVNSDQCLVKIESVLDPDDYYAISESSFTITTAIPSSVSMITPQSSGLKLQSGRVTMIDWSAYLVNDIDLDVSYDSGVTWHNIVENIPANQGSYEWLVPDSLYTTCYFRVVDSDNGANYDWSDYSFIIAELEMLNPEDGEVLTGDTTYTINWQSTNTGDLVLEFTTDGGVTWQIIDSSVNASSGSYDWLVPLLYSTECRIRLSDTDQDSIYALSENTFTIRPGIIIEAPVGGEFLLADLEYPILWDATSDVSQVVLDYSINNGSDWLPIESTPYDASSGSYSWLVPDTPSTEALIRIKKADDHSIYAVSEDVFTIIDEVLPPVPGFTADITHGIEPLTVQFTDQSLPGVGFITTWHWDFGDENISEEQHPQHTYQAPGVYTVSLTVTNLFDETDTLVMEDYITVLTSYPVLSLLTEEEIDFGIVYYQTESEYEQIIIANSGGIVLTITDIHFVDEPLHFEYYFEESGNIIIEPGAEETIYVRFTPQAEGELTDILHIVNDSENSPLLEIDLSGFGLGYHPPKPPDNLAITMDGYDAVITWDAVTENIEDQPIGIDYYFVYFNGSGIEAYPFYFLARSFDTIHTHYDAGLGADFMLYMVKAIVISDVPALREGNREYVEAYLEENLREGMTEAEVSEVLRKLSRDQQ